MKVEGSRLMLIPLSIKDLINISKEEKLETLNVDLSRLVISNEQKVAIEKKIVKMQNDEVDIHPWYTYWLIIDKENRFGMGLIGYKGLSEEGSCEIGYGISESFRRKGYTKEAVKTLVEWAFSDRRCKHITATRVLLENIGSQKILEANGFQMIDKCDKYYSYELHKELKF